MRWQIALLTSLCALGAGAQTPGPAPSGSTAPAPPAAVGTVVPDFVTRDLDGRYVDWKQLKGKTYLVDFWATWCGPCEVTLPELEALHRKYKTEGDFSVLGMALERGAAGAVRARRFASERGVTYPLYNDAGQTSARIAFGVGSIPDLVLVDASGAIVQRWIGSDTDFQEVDAAVAALLAKTRAARPAKTP